MRRGEERPHLRFKWVALTGQDGRNTPDHSGSSEGFSAAAAVVPYGGGWQLSRAKRVAEMATGAAAQEVVDPACADSSRRRGCARAGDYATVQRS